MTIRSAPGDVESSALSVGGAATLIWELTGHRPGHSTLWRWVRSGRLPATRIGAKYVVREHAVHELLARDASRASRSLQHDRTRERHDEEEASR